MQSRVQCARINCEIISINANFFRASLPRYFATRNNRGASISAIGGTISEKSRAKSERPRIDSRYISRKEPSHRSGTVVCEGGWLRPKPIDTRTRPPSRPDFYRSAPNPAEVGRERPKCVEQATRNEQRGSLFGFVANGVRVNGRGFASRAGVLRGKMSSLDYLDLCRLCLVKDRVSVPIFEGEGDVRQIFLKITACLPVKVRSQLRHHVQLWRPAIL